MLLRDVEEEGVESGFVAELESGQRLRPPLLYEEFRMPPEKRKSPSRRVLNLEETRYVLYRKTEHEAATVIAERLGVKPGTVRSLIRRVIADPSLFLYCGYLCRVQAGEDPAEQWLCRYCCALLKDWRKASAHGLEHLE